MNTTQTVQAVRSAFCIALLAIAAADPARAQAEQSLVELQSLTSQRAAAVQMASAMARASEADTKTVARNIGSGGASPHPAPALAWGRSPGLGARSEALQPRPAQPTLPPPRVTPRRDLAALNPQPLPPVERAAATARADQGVRPNAIIIVGGKPAR